MIAEYLPTAFDMSRDIEPLQDVQLYVMKPFSYHMNGDFSRDAHAC